MVRSNNMKSLFNILSVAAQNIFATKVDRSGDKKAAVSIVVIVEKKNITFHISGSAFVTKGCFCVRVCVFVFGCVRVFPAGSVRSGTGSPWLLPFEAANAS